MLLKSRIHKLNKRLQNVPRPRNYTSNHRPQPSSAYNSHHDHHTNTSTCLWPSPTK